MANENQASTSRTMIFVLLAVTLVSLVLQIVGLATNGWIVIHYSVSSPMFSTSLDISMGLWMLRYMYCTDGKCETFKGSLRDLENLHSGRTGLTSALENELDEYRGETITGAITICIAVFCIAIQLWRKTVNHSNAEDLFVWILACFSAGASALMAALASGKFGRNMSDTHSALGFQSPYLIPYSIILTGVGAVLAAFTFFAAAITSYRVYNRGNVYKQQQQQMVAMGQQHPQQQY